MLIVSPYHLDEPLPTYSGPRDVTIAVDLPDVNDRWTRMELVYEQEEAQNVAASADAPVIIAGDCPASLGVLAGLQRSAHDLGIVWFDVYGDFNTEQTTTSGYLGGLPLALAVGVGTRACLGSAFVRCRRNEPCSSTPAISTPQRPSHWPAATSAGPSPPPSPNTIYPPAVSTCIRRGRV